MRLFLPLLAWLTRVYGLGIPLSSRQPGQFTEFQGKRVCFGSVKEVRVPLAGATREELQEYLTPERVATAMWDREKVRSVGDGCYELRMEKLSFVMLDIDSISLSEISVFLLSLLKINVVLKSLLRNYHSIVEIKLLFILL